MGELLPRLDRGDKVLLLDVRNEEEYESWKVEPRRAVETIHVPYFDFIEDADGSIAKVPKDREVVVLCAQGGSSEMIVDMLGEAGIASKNIKGGMIAYGVYLEPVKLPLAAAEAARYQLWQVNRRGKACLSYVIVSGGEAVVVDPSRHAAWYEGFVAERGARIVRVLDTHVHADHVSGGPALARELGVPYFVAAGEGFELTQPVTPLVDGERLQLGGARGVSIEVRVLSTPGHTPGSTSFLVDGSYLLTGDTLFVASVGRPDLGGHVVEWGQRPLRHAEAAAGRPAGRDARPARALRGHRRDLRGGRRLGSPRRAAAHGPRDADRHGGRIRRRGAGRGEGPAEGLRRDHPGEPRRRGQRGEDLRVGARQKPVRRLREEGGGGVESRP